MAGSAADFTWYGLASGADIEQGDILLGCPVFLVPPAIADAPMTFNVTMQRCNVVVMTQSCDLIVRKDGRCAVDDVILLPVYSRAELQGHRVYGKAQGWEEARKGRHAGYHVLNRCDLRGHEFDYSLVDLRRVFTLSVDLVRAVAASRGDRVRLLPPYREHLSQAFARFFMRVGLPVDIVPFVRRDAT